MKKAYQIYVEDSEYTMNITNILSIYAFPLSPISLSKILSSHNIVIYKQNMDTE